MDFLTFGLLAGSVVVIASFLIRDAAPHLSALSPSPPFGRLSRRETPLAWRRWCADAGLVVSAAGTLVLLATVGALVANVADGVGTVVVGLALTAALVCAALGLARLTVRYRHDVAAERAGAPMSHPVAPPAEPVAASPPVAAPPAGPVDTRTTPSPAATPAADATADLRAGDDATELWDDDLPTWSAISSTASPVVQPTTTGSSVRPSPAPPNVTATTVDETDRADALQEDDGVEHHHPALPIIRMEPVARRSRAGDRVRDAVVLPAAVDPIGGEPAGTVIGGAFSSPLLADIGLTSSDEAADGFRSRLLLDLDRPMALVPGDEAETGSDVLLDESPVPTFPGARARDELG